MSQRRVKCPKCGQLLLLPDDILTFSVRCSACRSPFQLPRRTVPEQTVFGWLHHQRDADDEEISADTLSPFGDEGPTPHSPGHLRLVTLSGKGALLEFSTDSLRLEEFRAGFPRVCIHCQARSHLSAHLVVFATQSREGDLQAEHKAGALVVAGHKLADVHGAELLARLPLVPNIPPPGNLPMPYWVCDLCSGAGEVAGQIRVNTDTGHGVCRLNIANLHVAASFLAAVDGTRTPAYSQIRDVLELMQEDRYEGLPTVIRHRLEGWFKPSTGERFLVYAPDRSRTRTEDGVSGVVVTSKRLIYHRPPLHGELPAATPITIAAKISQGKEVLMLTGGDWISRSLPLDRSGLMALRRGLSEGHFKVKWL